MHEEGHKGRKAPLEASSSSEPAAESLYRIHHVAERTGIPEPTLRAWERRYGIPRPQRTDSGYRLYSEQDIALARRMRELCEGGMAAAEAARLVRSGEAPRRPAAVKDEEQGPRSALLDAVARYDAAALTEQLGRLHFVDNPLTVLELVLEPTLREVGERWHSGDFSIAQEHLFSQKVDTLLRDYLRMVPRPPDAPLALLASFDEEQHELGLLAAAVYLASAGLRCELLGARTPPSALGSAVEALRPSLVGLSLTVRLERARARELLDEYARAVGSTPWILGGSGVSPLADLARARGALLAPTAPAALLELVRSLTRRQQRRAPRNTR